MNKRQEIIDRHYAAMTKELTDFDLGITEKLQPVSDAKKERFMAKVWEHKLLLQEKMYDFIYALEERAKDHDDSKLQEPELTCFASFETKEYMSNEYKENINKLSPCLNNHYKNNRHHPEHFDNGIDEMNLIDVVEMFVDWYASCQQHGGSIEKSLIINKDRFNMSNQLTNILYNTIKELD